MPTTPRLIPAQFGIRSPSPAFTLSIDDRTVTISQDATMDDYTIRFEAIGFGFTSSCYFYSLADLKQVINALHVMPTSISISTSKYTAMYNEAYPTPFYAYGTIFSEPFPTFGNYTIGIPGMFFEIPVIPKTVKVIEDAHEYIQWLGGDRE